MGDYDVIYDGVPLKAKVVDNYKVVDQLIPDYFGSEDVIGIDFKKFPKTGRTHISHISHILPSSYDILVLCGTSRCLIIHSDFMMEQLSSLKEFLEDCNICFVRPSILKDNSSASPGVAVCELAARVLKKSKLKKESSLEVIAREVGVKFQDVYGSILLNSDSDKILTQEQVEMVAYRAFTCHRIGSKLLSSLE